MDSITSTANSADCPGYCVHTLATLICYEVLEDVQCPTASMRCCVEAPINSTDQAESYNNINENVTTVTTATKATAVASTTTPSSTTTALTTAQTTTKTTTVFTNLLIKVKKTKFHY